jgi:hypothetical protein
MSIFPAILGVLCVCDWWRELKIDIVNMEAIIKSPTPTNIIEVRIFVGATQYLWKFIASCSTMVAPLHAIKTNNKSF